jgi:hypothetical protein
MLLRGRALSLPSLTMPAPPRRLQALPSASEAIEIPATEQNSRRLMLGRRSMVLSAPNLTSVQNQDQQLVFLTIESSGVRQYPARRRKTLSELLIKDKHDCRWDIVSLGEVMLRLDPGDGRVHTTRNFQVWEGGGEYNVARGLKRCFGLEAAVVTAFADNAVGRLVQDPIYQGGVDQSHVKWVKFDGVGRTVRNGLNFTERGFDVRASRRARSS